MKVHTTEEAVRYVETDRMQVVHHSVYLHWFEVGRTSLLAAAGFPYDKLERSGMLFPVIEYTCRLISVADYGDTVRIETHIDRLRSRTVQFGYEAFVGDRLVATGTTKHVAVDSQHKPRRMDATLVGALEEYTKVRDR